MNENNIVTGTVEGTGASINIQCGFQPRVVKVYNVDGVATLMWNSGMPAASGLKMADSGAGATDISWITSLGISVYVGTAGANNEGFTIGADADVNVSAQTIYYEAFR